MKIHDVLQGSGDWHRLRIGIPTASNFHRVVTPAGKLSKQAWPYAYFLIAEKLLNESLDSIDHLEWVGRGKELEPEAVRLYEFQNEVKTAPVGFITTDDGRIGCTPDRLIVGHSAALEMKCPAPQTHVGYLLDGFGLDYVPQAQGQMLVGEFEFVDRYSYHPRMPPVRVRTYRDEAYLRTLADALAQFCDTLAAMLDKARSLGLFAERERLQTQLDEYARSGSAAQGGSIRLNEAAMRLLAP
jgi:hypothetical protein